MDLYHRKHTEYLSLINYFLIIIVLTLDSLRKNILYCCPKGVIEVLEKRVGNGVAEGLFAYDGLSIRSVDLILYYRVCITVLWDARALREMLSVSSPSASRVRDSRRSRINIATMFVILNEFLFSKELLVRIKISFDSVDGFC